MSKVTEFMIYINSPVLVMALEQFNMLTSTSVEMYNVSEISGKGLRH